MFPTAVWWCYAKEEGGGGGLMDHEDREDRKGWASEELEVEDGRSGVLKGSKEILKEANRNSKSLNKRRYDTETLTIQCSLAYTQVDNRVSFSALSTVTKSIKSCKFTSK